ncbi:MAG TPA: PEP/pyruvate-binding domain-containing protein [Polyangiaceae bacterium]|nr:PEP/pyruvate-binding domain-containing protein [Polyangiaceae bacterium]
MMPVFSTSLLAGLRLARPSARWACAATQFGSALCASIVVIALGACGSSDGAGDTPPTLTEWPCEIPSGTTAPDSLAKTGCKADFLAVSSKPLDASIPGARSGKVIMDLLDNDTLYFQNSQIYEIHYQFAKAHLNGMGNRSITTLPEFNPQYTLPLEQRRFLLGAVTYYEQPDVWALEIAPYDTSTPEMIAKLYNAVKNKAFYGPALAFHPTSEAVEAQAKKLSSDIKIKTTNDLFANIDYQPLNIGEAIGTLKFVNAADLANIYVNARDVVVLDEVPNDISPTAALITQQFQTPLSHINVLARNRHTPNMGLRKAVTNSKLTDLKGKQVKITVEAFEWKIAEVSQAESDAWWAAHMPPKVTLPDPDLKVKDLRDIATVTEHTDTPPYVTLDAIQAATRAFGAKAANYSVFATDKDVPNKKAFAIPVFYYDQFMEENLFYARAKAFAEDPEFVAKEEVRSAKLAQLRADILTAPVNAEFQALLKAKFDQDYPGKSMRFRSSTNAEDLDGFPCAGCYDSHTGDPNDSKYMGNQVLAALDGIRKTWATVWSFRTYEERRLHSIDHNKVAMALLVHTNFPDEEANGVAITANIFDASGNAPGFYVNVQKGGEFEVVHPPPGITSDSFLYQFNQPNQPIIYYTHSNVVDPGAHVLTERQIYDLGRALDILHKRFANAYQTSPTAWYAIDSEFKFDDEATPGMAPSLYIKQARPYPGPQ